MNKIYKVVWSKVRNAYVVVSEIAKSHSRSKSQAGTKVVNSLLTIAVVTSFAVGGTLLNPMSVDAANVTAGTVRNGNGNTLAVGSGSTASGAGAVTVGGGTSSTGTRAIAVAGAQANSDYAIAMGEDAVAGGVYTGSGVLTSSGTNAIAIGRAAKAYGLNDVVIGANQTAMTPTFAPAETNADGSGGSANGGRVMIGHDNIATGRAGNSVILGSNNRSNVTHGLAIGQNASVGQPMNMSTQYENSMAIGTNTRSYATGTIAIGSSAVAGNTDASRTQYDNNGELAIAIGQSAVADNHYTVALGGVRQRLQGNLL